MSAPLTSAAGQFATPHGQGGVEARQLRLPLQVVSHMAVKAGDASREQVQHRHLTEVRPLWQRAAQSEDCGGRKTKFGHKRLPASFYE